MTPDPEILHQHRRALDVAGQIVTRIRVEDLARSTPCAGWDLAALLIHCLGQNHGFAAALRDGDAPAATYSGPDDLDPVRLHELWTNSADQLSAAAAGAPPDRPVRLVEFGPNAVFPAAAVVGFHVLDTTVHAWDLASSLGEDFRPDDDLVAATLEQARAVPGGEARTRPGAAFAPEVASDDADPWTEALALLGRSAPR